MNLKVKLLAEWARISPPSYPGDAGYDVYSTVDRKSTRLNSSH